MNTIQKPSFFILIVLLLCFYQLQTLYPCGVQNKEPFSDEETRNGKRLVNIKPIEQKRIYLCALQEGNGFREIKKVLSSVYDDYSIEFLRDKEIPPYFYSSNYTHPTNIFVDTYEFPSCKPQWLKWLLLHFEGHYNIFFSPESPKELPYNEDSSLQDRFHAIGPVLSKKKNEPLVTYLQAVWWDRLQTELSIEKLTMRRNEKRADVEKRKFLIYANSNCVKFREEAIGKSSFVGVIDCNGKCQGKLGTPKQENIKNTKGTPRINVGNWWLNAALYREYKFCFVMEHEIDHPLYITEKILLAFSANCIPIYHGPTLIFEFFNKNAFIFYNISDPQPSIDLIDSLNKNDTALQLMMEEPILAKGDETIEEFFSFGESIGKGKLRQKFRSMINGLD